MYINHTTLEKNIFQNVQTHFEDIPSFSHTDYDNLFFDIIAMYGFGGQEYIDDNYQYEKMISIQLEGQLNKLSILQKKELIHHYETHFLKNYQNNKNDNFHYTDKDFIEAMLSNFKTWVNDNFSDDDLSEVEKIIEFDKHRGEEAVSFINEVINNLLRKDFPILKKRKLEIAKAYLKFHPLAPIEDYHFSIGFKNNDLFFSIDYSSYLIKIEIYNTEDGQCWHSFKDEITIDGYSELKGFYDEYKPFFFSNLEDKKPNQISVTNELP